MVLCFGPGYEGKRVTIVSAVLHAYKRKTVAGQSLLPQTGF
jgi:hypothetical protein